MLNPAIWIGHPLRSSPRWFGPRPPESLQQPRLTASNVALVVGPIRASLPRTPLGSTSDMLTSSLRQGCPASHRAGSFLPVLVAVGRV